MSHYAMLNVLETGMEDRLNAFALGCPAFLCAHFNKKKGTARFESIGGYALLEKLAAEIGVRLDLNQLSFSETFRPYFKNTENVDFNISHSKGLVICVLSLHAKVGIDLESLEEGVQVRHILDLMSPAEKEIIKHSANPKRCALQLWTRKEAVIKAHGIGLMSDHIPQITDLTGTIFAGLFYHLYELNAGPNFICLLASTKSLKTHFIP